MNQHYKHKASTWPPSSVVDRHFTGSDDLAVTAKKPMRDGHIKWYDLDRKFGFVVDAETGRDIFLHWRCLKKCNIRPIDVKEESHVRFTSRPPSQEGHYRDEVTELVLVRS